MSSRKQLSPFKKTLGILGILAAMVVGLFLGLMATGGPFWRDSGPPADLGHGGRLAIVFSFVLGVLSVVALLVGVAMYVVVLATRLFFFDFKRPVWSSFKSRLLLANILVPLPIGLGLGGLVAAIGSPFLVSLGMGYETALLVLFFVPIVLLQFVTIWLSIWTPLVSRLTLARLRALGVEPARMDQGILMGISDPAQKSLTKFGLIEDDIGMLWIEPDELVYEGDNDEFRIRREQCLSIERVADAGSISAYFGNVHIILTIQEDGAGPRRVRLHPESSMTMTGIARASDRLADELERWKGAAPSGGSSILKKA
jgi:hypothetical protein